MSLSLPSACARLVLRRRGLWSLMWHLSPYANRRGSCKSGCSFWCNLGGLVMILYDLERIMFRKSFDPSLLQLLLVGRVCVRIRKCSPTSHHRPQCCVPSFFSLLTR